MRLKRLKIFMVLLPGIGLISLQAQPAMNVKTKSSVTTSFF